MIGGGDTAMERCPVVLLMCCLTTIYVSSYKPWRCHPIYCYICGLILLCMCVLILLYTAMEERPGVATALTSVYVFSYYYICVLVILYVCVLKGCDTAMAIALVCPPGLFVCV